MDSILKTCKPRPDIIAGTFNPEIFTASLRPVIEFYRTGIAAIDNLYTDARLFFKDGTYPTQGLRTTLNEVFARIAGDTSVPAIHRLETAFGGGKTHTLIACTHIAHRGRDLQDVVSNVINPKLLPEPHSVSVVGVAGDEIPVHKPKGEQLIPHTLWGEIAYQIGGEPLYREVEDEANSHAAPGRTFFEKVLGNRKVLIMLDELAQYAARLEAARSDGASQLAAFLMALHGYARNHPGIAIVLTLASAADAFGKQTKRLATLISQVRGEEVSEDDALGIGEQAIKGVASVVARDAVQITPVQAAEISSVLAKRLFIEVDRDAARRTADEYMSMYRRNSTLLPEEASSEDFRERMVATYPFHPTLVDFLNNKLSEAENFQGTRGVLRLLALAVRSLWQKQQGLPMIHACHLDLRSDKVANEVLGRTSSSDLLLVLNADVGGIQTESLEGGRSNAELCDQRNPHPEGYPLYEYTWKTVFLHSLVGRNEGLTSKIFGLTESEALFAVSFPGMTPPQVRTALEEINESAFYLRFDQGKYFATDQPTLNSVLAKIRRTLTAREVETLLVETARKMIKGGSGIFNVEHDVSLPEHIPDDGKDKPVLGVVSPTAEQIDVEAIVTTKGPNLPRERQNLVFLLVPQTVKVTNDGQDGGLFDNHESSEVRQRIDTIARQVKAMKILIDRPENYGVNPRRLQEEDFRKRKAERDNALHTAVASIYNSFYYPGEKMVRREIRTAGGESGVSFIEQIREILLQDKKLVTAQNVTKSDLTNLSQFFFSYGDTVELARLRTNFSCLRSWPVLESPGVLDQIIRAGVKEGFWCVFRMAGGEQAKPAEIYHSENQLPLNIDLRGEGYSLIKVQGAKQRGWLDTTTVEPAMLRRRALDVVTSNGSANVGTVFDTLREEYGEIATPDLESVVSQLIREGRLCATRGEPEPSEIPELITRETASLYAPNPEDLLLTREEVLQRGWESEAETKLKLQGEEAVKKVLPLLRRIGSLYNRGGKSTVDMLDLVDLELPEGGTITVRLADVTPKSMQILGELLEVLAGVVVEGENTEVFLTISEPDEECPLIKELKS